MPHPRAVIPSLLAGLALTVAGCSAPETRSGPIDPGLINHVVLITLEDPGDARELERDCEALLAGIPSVAVYACGPHHETGRETVDDGYDVGLFVSFRSAGDYAAYLADPGHVALVEKWRPRWSEINIYDIENR